MLYVAVAVSLTPATQKLARGSTQGVSETMRTVFALLVPGKLTATPAKSRMLGVYIHTIHMYISYFESSIFAAAQRVALERSLA